MSRAHDGAGMLSLAQARDALSASIRPIVDTEVVALRDSLGRVMARDLVAAVRVPAHDNAAMDGYALRVEPGDGSADLAPPRSVGTSLRIVGRARAGHPHVGDVGRDDCVRILTGAMMPVGCNTVVPQEEVGIDGDRVTLERPVRAGQHRRLAGEDLAVGATVIPAGRSITPSDLGLAASVGAATLRVVRRPRVAVFSTGNELSDVDEPLAVGGVRDSNRYTLIGMLTRLGVEVIDQGIVRDDPAALEASLLHACGDDVRADAIITSGGVSAGDADYTRDVLQRVGEVSFWKLAVKPGRPMAFGRIVHGEHAAWLFGLPGNPVAAMVVFHALVRNALLTLAGGTVALLPALTAICDEDLAKSPGRTEFLRGIARRDEDGWHVRTTGTQSSGVLRSMSAANCLIVLDHDRGRVTKGETIEAWPFDGLT